MCTAMLQDLLERGLRVDESILCVVDGGKGIRKALVDVLGDLAVIQRCQIHKLRNLRSYLPKSRHAYVLQTMKEAYKCKSADKARKRLQALVSWLERNGYDEGILPERSSVASSGQRVFTAKSSKLAGTIVSSRSNGERCTEPRGDSKTRLITPRTSSTLNTSFIERLNLTIRQSSAYLSRRTLSHARSTERLDEHLELLRCYYNFVRPHGALKFGREIRTPAMQAGLTTRRLTFRDIFLATTIPLWARIEVFLLTRARNPVLCQNSALLK